MWVERPQRLVDKHRKVVFLGDICAHYILLLTDVYGMGASLLPFPPSATAEFSSTSTAHRSTQVASTGADPSSQSEAEVTMEVLSSPITSASAHGAVELVLVDALLGIDLITFDPIMPTVTIDLEVIGTNQLSVRADVSGHRDVEVRFDLDGTVNYHTERAVPFMLNGGSDGITSILYPWTATLGLHVVTATAFAEESTMGSTTVMFMVISGSPTTDSATQPPTISDDSAATATPSTVAVQEKVCTQESGLDYAGNDIQRDRGANSTAECAQACINHPDCGAYSYFCCVRLGGCFLKHSTTGVTASRHDVVSGRCVAGGPSLVTISDGREFPVVFF